jgi:MoxR-like ATPase
VADLARLGEARAVVAAVRLADPIVDYVVDLVRATRGRPTLSCGASPRAANMLAAASRALAVLRGRDYVIPDDVKDLAVPVLRHRVLLAPGAEIEGLTPETVVTQVLEQVAAPR